ncbi:MAG: hypothetical protein LOD89_08020, partial [Tissierellales bacterium]
MKLLKKAILLGIILILSSPVLGLKPQKPDKLELMMDILKKADASFVEGDISLGGAILDKMLTIDEMDEIGESIKDELNIQGSLLSGQFNSIDQLKEGFYSK